MLMEDLIKQTRVRFSDAKQEDIDAANIKGRRIPPQRTRSFKGEKSRTQNWFQRQFSGNTSWDNDTCDGGDYQAAVAAAAYAINSLYDIRAPQKKQSDPLVPETFSTKIKSKAQDTQSKMREPARRTKSSSGSAVNSYEPEVPEFPSSKMEGKTDDPSTKTLEPARRSISSSSSESSDEKVTSVRKFFGNTSDQAPPLKKKTSFGDTSLMNADNEKENGRAITPKPSLKKRLSFANDKSPTKRPPTFADNIVESTGSRGPEKAGLIPGFGMPKLDPRAPMPTTLSPTGAGVPGSTRAGGTKADMWERAEMVKVKKRYETLRNEINSWENKKKLKAKRGMEKTERELEQKRVRALQHFRNEMESIDAVARGARAEAEKKKGKEDLKVKTKATKIRTTGKLPPRCFWF